MVQAREALQRLPAMDDDWLRWAWFYQEMYENRPEEALDRLTSTTEGWIRLDPCWSELRRQPRYRQMAAQYGKPSE